MRKILLLSIFILLSSHNNTIFAKLHTFVPENDLKISIYDKNASLNQADYDSVVKRIKTVYSPIVRELKDSKFRMDYEWYSETVNAYVSFQFETYSISIFGGLARYNGMTKDGLAIIGCHEIGHMLGGAPKNGNVAWTWASAEGQADYYATLKCFRELYADDDNESIISKMEVSEIDKHKCQNAFVNVNDIFLCIRASQASLVVVNVLKDIANINQNLSLDTPNQTEVSSTIINGYPELQCRLDSYFQGALCDISADENTSDIDINMGVCSRSAGITLGTRPLCWFKPRS